MVNGKVKNCMPRRKNYINFLCNAITIDWMISDKVIKMTMIMMS